VAVVGRRLVGEDNQDIPVAAVVGEVPDRLWPEEGAVGRSEEAEGKLRMVAHEQVVVVVRSRRAVESKEPQLVEVEELDTDLVEGGLDTAGYAADDSEAEGTL
jgi:hypothetical protein